MLFRSVKQTLQGWNDGQLPAGVVVDQHRERQPILEYFRVNAAIREALKPRVDLPSGGYIIIEPTEALTVVDVNSGSFTRSNTSRETVLWTNCEAATEIARQMRLRNIAGVIIIDFIDMDYRKDQLQVLEHFNKQLRVDKARPQIAQLSELGLVELTRKRQGQNIYELFGETCATCGGLGHLAHVPGEAVYDANGEAVAVSLVSTTPQREYRGRNNTENSSTSSRSLSRGPRRNDRTLPDLRQPIPAPPAWDAFEQEGAESGDDFNLVNHPSYQDPNGGGKKRRRRVGRTEREEVVRNVPRPTNSSDTPRLPVPNGTGSRVIIAANRTTAPVSEETSKATLVSRNFAPPELEAYVPEPFDTNIVELAGDTEASERERPEKPQRVKPTRPTIEPPEVVQVEMSDLEKETYAWMGISPLVKLGRELVNPKTAIINVVPIGTLPLELVAVADSIPTTVEAESKAIESPDLELIEPTPTDDFMIPVVMEKLSSEVVDVVDIPVITTEVSDPVVETAIVDEVMEIATPEAVEAPTAIVDEPEELPENRRRKRRSSAAVD